MGRNKAQRTEPFSGELPTAEEVESVAALSGFPVALVEEILVKGYSATAPLAKRLRKTLAPENEKLVQVRVNKPPVSFTERMAHQGRAPEGRVVRVVPVTKLEPGMWLMVSGSQGAGWIEITGQPVRGATRFEVVVPTTAGNVISEKKLTVRVAVPKHSP